MAPCRPGWAGWTLQRAASPELAVSINEHRATATLVDSINAGDKGGRLRPIPW